MKKTKIPSSLEWYLYVLLVRTDTSLVRMKGLEPPRRWHWFLRPARLPVPPHPHILLFLTNDCYTYWHCNEHSSNNLSKFRHIRNYIITTDKFSVIDIASTTNLTSTNLFNNVYNSILVFTLSSNFSLFFIY